MSSYADDPRVVWPPGGVSSNVVAYLPDSDHDGGGRMVVTCPGGFAVKGVVDRNLSITSTWGPLAVFVSVDEALRAVLDAPISGKVA